MNSLSNCSCGDDAGYHQPGCPSHIQQTEPTAGSKCESHSCDACGGSANYDESGDKIVCACFQVTESAVITAVATWNLSSVKDLCRFTNAGAGCTACRLRLKKYLVRQSAPPAMQPTAMQSAAMHSAATMQ